MLYVLFQHALWSKPKGYLKLILSRSLKPPLPRVSTYYVLSPPDPRLRVRDMRVLREEEDYGKVPHSMGSKSLRVSAR